MTWDKSELLTFAFFMLSAWFVWAMEARKHFLSLIQRFKLKRYFKCDGQKELFERRIKAENVAKRKRSKFYSKI